MHLRLDCSHKISETRPHRAPGRLSVHSHTLKKVERQHSRIWATGDVITHLPRGGPPHVMLPTQLLWLGMFWPGCRRMGMCLVAAALVRWTTQSASTDPPTPLPEFSRSYCGTAAIY